MNCCPTLLSLASSPVWIFVRFWFCWDLKDFFSRKAILFHEMLVVRATLYNECLLYKFCANEMCNLKAHFASTFVSVLYVFLTSMKGRKYR